MVRTHPLSGKYAIFCEGNGRSTAVAKDVITKLRIASRQYYAVTQPYRKFLATSLITHYFSCKESILFQLL